LKTFAINNNFILSKSSRIGANEPLYFCDICAGPGGFSEYVLWRKKYGTCKGFGMTLRDENDFHLDDFIAGQPEYFEPFYGRRINSNKK
jgi:cap1 methyltransferase